MKSNLQESFNEEYIEEDDIDLVKLVSSSADVANQYVLFEGFNNEYYAINVAKVEELFAFNKQEMIRNNDKNSFIIGTADIRSHMTPLVYFDEWFGNGQNNKAEELLIWCYFSSRYLGLIVKQVIDIVSISPQQMHSNSDNNPLTTFIAKISLGHEEILCTIFDTDKLLFDLYGNDSVKQSTNSEKIVSNKIVLFADDSKLVAKMAYDTFEKLGVNYRIFNDGQALLDAIETLEAKDIGIFLLDVEMPRKTGIDVIHALKKESKYDDIPIIVHTNMANNSIMASLNAQEVTQIVAKVDFATIESAIREYML